MVSLVTYALLQCKVANFKKFKFFSTAKAQNTPLANEKRCPFGVALWQVCAPLISLGVRNRKSLDDRSLIFGGVTWQKTLAPKRMSQAHALSIFIFAAAAAAAAATRFCFAARASHGKWRARRRSLQLAHECDECAGACGARLGAIRNAFLGARAANKKCCKGKLPPDHFL